MANYGYDKNVDYQKLINQDVQAQDWRSAAIHEAQRNEKIRGEGAAEYQTTNHYADYLPRTDQINSGMDRLANPQAWDYDYRQDPAWQAYRKEYLREADRGTRDTMANAAALTGGIPSTAAVGAAQQAGNYYRAQLADKIPELMQNDYSRYLQGREADRADLSLLSSIEAQRAADSLGLQQFSWQKEGDLWQRNYTEQQAAIAAAMNRWATLGYADQGVADVLGVPVGTSTQDAKYQQAQLDYQRWQQQQAERGDAYDRAMAWIQMGLVPDDATLAAAGLNRAQAQQAAARYQQQLAARYSGGSSGGSSGSRSSRSSRSSSGGSGGGDGDDSDKDSAAASEANRQAYTSAKTGILFAAQTGNVNYAIDALDRYADMMTPEQAAELMDMLDRLFPNGRVRGSGSSSGSNGISGSGGGIKGGGTSRDVWVNMGQ